MKRIILSLIGAVLILATTSVITAQVLPGFEPDELELMYTLRDVDGSSGNMQMSATIAFYDDGQRLGQVLIHDLKPFLTTQEKQDLAAIMARLRTSAEGFYLE